GERIVVAEQRRELRAERDARRAVNDVAMSTSSAGFSVAASATASHRISRPSASVSPISTVSPPPVQPGVVAAARAPRHAQHTGGVDTWMPRHGDIDNNSWSPVTMTEARAANASSRYLTSDGSRHAVTFSSVDTK